MTDWSSGAKALLLFQLSSLHGVDEETNGKRAALIAQIAALDNQERLIELSLSPEERAAKAAKRAAKVAADTVFEKRKGKIQKRAGQLTEKLISRKIGFKISTLLPQNSKEADPRLGLSFYSITDFEKDPYRR